MFFFRPPHGANVLLAGRVIDAATFEQLMAFDPMGVGLVLARNDQKEAGRLDDLSRRMEVFGRGRGGGSQGEVLLLDHFETGLATSVSW